MPVDTVSQSDEDWLLNIQRKLFQWSKMHSKDSYNDLWNWIIDPRNLRIAWKRVSTNQGKNTPGIDGMTTKKIQGEMGVDAFLLQLREKLHKDAYSPSPVRRKWIPKPGKPDKLRGLGIPTIEDRMVQSAIKQIIEPIFEPRFYYVSQGFRPGRAVRDAIALLRLNIRAFRGKDKKRKKITPLYQWVIEGDIKSCFDKINHHALMNRVRNTIKDRKVNRLITSFLKSGIMEENFRIERTQFGTPQGGILSPLLCNIALGIIEEQYERWLYPTDRALHTRYQDRKRNHPIFYPIRYADDFVILCCGTQEDAEKEKAKLALILQQQLGLELSEEKTRVTNLQSGFDFLGHHIRLRWRRRLGWILETSVPPTKQKNIRREVKKWTKRSNLHWPLERLIRKLNPILRGWGGFYQHATQAYCVFNKIDNFVFERIWFWLRRKHPKLTDWQIFAKYRQRGGLKGWKRWSENKIGCLILRELPRGRWDMKKRRLPAYMHPAGEPGT